jgi:hypothetical protein
MNVRGTRDLRLDGELLDVNERLCTKSALVGEADY